MTYGAILADPPWQQRLSGKYGDPRNKRPDALPYPTMTVDEIAALPVPSWCEPDAHLWLWTTNSFLRAGFDVLDAWGFRYLAPVVWVKPSGTGNYFIHRTQTLLFGYKGKLKMQQRYLPNVIEAPARRHSQKPLAAYDLVERVSAGPFLELFARPPVREGWSARGNEVNGEDIRLTQEEQ